MDGDIVKENGECLLHPDGLELYRVYVFLHAVLRLKGQKIPSNGAGVVIFDDVGGYLGPEDGLLCVAMQLF